MRMVLTLFLVLVVPAALAMEPRTAHTYQLAEGETAPVVALSEIAWLAGHWTGTGFGQTFEETWHLPSAGSMVGMFKLIGKEGVNFYELMTLSSDDGRLSLKVKHFSADFVSWEEKEKYVNFKLVGIEKDAVHFSGISFYRLGPDRLEGFVVMRQGDEIREEKLTYERKIL